MKRQLLKTARWGCGLMGLIILCLIAALIFALHRVPANYPPAPHPIDVAADLPSATNEIDGFESPYLGHTGSWDGKGGGMFGSSKLSDLDAERAMGLRWTFMAVYWKAMEPDHAVNLTNELPAAWRELDAFIIAARERGLNVLMQAPVVGGNAGGPPGWAGRREEGKSAPANMAALAAFAGKLADRYAPGGALARQQGWNSSCGVRAWELDNEPNSYFTHWKNQEGDYAEFVTLAAAAIRRADPKALIVGPAVAAGSGAREWIEGTLDAKALRGSPEYRDRGTPFSIGPSLDVVSFHVYEGMDSAFARADRTIEMVFSDAQETFERWEEKSDGFHYPRKRQYWHTEGNFDFFGVLSKERRAAWRMQFFTRAFAAGVAKVVVMDASKPEQAAVRAYIEALPEPFPMRRAGDEVTVLKGRPVVFCHEDSSGTSKGRVWVLWATADTGDAEVRIPCSFPKPKCVTPGGPGPQVTPADGFVQIHLPADLKMPPPVILIDRPVDPPR